MNRSVTISVVVGVLLVAAVLIAWQSSAPAQDRAAAAKEKEDHRGTLATAGFASTQVKPDSARVYFRIDSYAETIQQARGDNAKLVDGVLESLRKLKIKDLKMKSSDVHVELVTNRRTDQDRLPRVLGYHITHTFTVLVENDDSAKLAADASRILDTALANGATGVDQIQFFARDLEKVRRELLTKAVEDAMRNARALAAGANRTISEIASIHGQPQYSAELSNSQRQQNVFLPGNNDSTPLVAGDLVVTCNVSLSCKYEN